MQDKSMAESAGFPLWSTRVKAGFWREVLLWRLSAVCPFWRSSGSIGARSEHTIPLLAPGRGLVRFRDLGLSSPRNPLMATQLGAAL